MPITYSIDPVHRIAIKRFVGDITAADLAEHWQIFLHDPQALALQKDVSDLRQANILLTGPELERLIDGIVIPLLQGRTWKTALVVSDALQFGVSRQYQAFAQLFSRDAIFDDYDAAVKWLVAPGASECERGK